MKGCRFWQDEWKRAGYLKAKVTSFDAIDKAVSEMVEPPKTVLDIGCGYAYESQWMQEKYGCDLYLLDGDSETNTAAKKRDVKFGKAESFAYYLPIDTLVKSWHDRGLRYEYIDAQDPVLPDMVFDVIYSNLSCGFHYPISAYNSLLLKHSDDDTVMIFDIRAEYFYQAAQQYEIVEILHKEEKFRKCRIKLVR